MILPTTKCNQKCPGLFLQRTNRAQHSTEAGAMTFAAQGDYFKGDGGQIEIRYVFFIFIGTVQELFFAPGILPIVSMIIQKPRHIVGKLTMQDQVALQGPNSMRSVKGSHHITTDREYWPRRLIHVWDSRMHQSGKYFSINFVKWINPHLCKSVKRIKGTLCVECQEPPLEDRHPTVQGGSGVCRRTLGFKELS